VILLILLLFSAPADEYYRQAHARFLERKIPEALTAVDQALALDPKLVPALILKARLAMAINRYDAARDCLTRALAVEPTSWSAQFLFGFQFYEQNEIPRAIVEFEKARRLNPRDTRTALYLGRAYETVGRTREALGLYKEALRLEQKPAIETLLTCFRLQLLLGDLEDCRQLIEQALRLAPESRDAHFEAGRLLLRQAQPEAAVAEAERALALREGEVTERQVLYLLIQACQAAGRAADAARHADALRALESGL
jgi:tetratricopeptide (TPR) repeat protein